MFRTGNGNVIGSIADLEEVRRRWIAEGRTVRTYCSKASWDDYPEDLGELLMTGGGLEMRVHATMKSQVNNTYRIVHNCLIVGNQESGWEWYPMVMLHWRELFTGRPDPPHNDDNGISGVTQRLY